MNKAVFPRPGWMLLIIAAGIVSLLLAFGTWLGDTPFAYCAYLLSAYALVVAAAAAARAAAPVVEAAKGLPVIGRFIQNQYSRIWLGLRFSLAVNLLFAAVRLGYAIRFASFWDGGLAVYHILLCVVQALLVRWVPATAAQSVTCQDWKRVRAVGMLLFGLNVALVWVSTQIVLNGQGYRYPGLLVYTMATYAFYCLGLAIWGRVKFRRFESPLLTAVKSVNLTCALVSLFSLETAMLTEFGSGSQELFRMVMTGCTGLAVCLIVLLLAMLLMRRAGENLKNMEEEEP